MEEESLLIDAPFKPDPEAEEELGVTDLQAIADEDLKGSRLLLVRRLVEPIKLDGTFGGVVQFACTFQAAPGSRFTFAQLKMRLSSPAGIKIIDLAPRSVDDPNPVEITLGQKGELGIKNLPLSVEPGIEVSKSKKYTKYHCKVQGSGEGSNLARWDFRENPDRKDGIGAEQVLSLTVPVTGPVSANVMVSARITHSGLRGKIDAFRDLILGSAENERSYPISFDIPTKPSANGLANFFRLF